MFQLNAQEKSLEILLDIDKNLPAYTLGDKIRVEQVVSNLLSNAIKFSPNNSNVSLKLIHLKSENKMKCEVSDFVSEFLNQNSKIFSILLPKKTLQQQENLAVPA